MTSNSLAPVNAGEPKQTIVQFLEQMKPQIQAALPVTISPDRFVRLALTTMRKTPKLQQCTPQSVVGSLLTAAALGLELDTTGEAYLVPYKNEAQLIVGYQGVSKLFWQHPLAARLSAEYVCENDEFSYDKGLNPSLHHVPATGDRGPVVAYYAIVGLQTGATWFDVFTPDQIRKIRKRSGASDGIDDPEHWMERKTALKQVLKLAPKSAQLAQAVRVDEQVGSMTMAQQVSAGTLPELPVVDDEAVDVETGEIVEQEALA